MHFLPRPGTSIISLLFIFSIFFLALQFTFGSKDNSLRHNYCTNDSIIISELSKNTTYAFNCASKQYDIVHSNPPSTISSINVDAGYKLLLTSNQLILHDKILHLFIKYKIMFLNMNFQLYVELLFPKEKYHLKAISIAAFNKLKKHWEKSRKFKDQIIYDDFYNDIIGQHDDIVKFINKNKVNFTNMEGFYMGFIELLFYKYTCVEFKKISKSETEYEKMVKLSILNAQVNILKELIKFNIKITTCDMMHMVNNLMRNVLPVLVEAQIITEEIENDILRFYVDIYFVVNQNNPKDFMKSTFEEKLITIENYKNQSVEIISKNEE